MKKNTPKSLAGHRKALTVLAVVLGLVLALLLGGTFYAEYLLGRMNYVDPDQTVPTLSPEELAALEQETDPYDPDFTGPELNDEDVDFGNGPDTDIGGEHIVNILLIGQDTTDGQRARSDSMILCTFNTDKNTLTMTSFMRDMYVEIPGYKNNRINAAYHYGGMNLLNETLYVNFGVEIDGNVEVDFASFEDLIDLLGGVTLELTGAEAAYINKWVPGSYARTGENQLSGAQALMYARNRNDIDGDFSRTNRQRNVLNALIEEYKSKSLTTMIGLLDDILPMVTTNMTKSQITTYVKDLFPMLGDVEIITQRIPVDGGYYDAKINGMAVLVPDREKNIQALIDSLT